MQIMPLLLVYITLSLSIALLCAIRHFIYHSMSYEKYIVIPWSYQIRIKWTTLCDSKFLHRYNKLYNMFSGEYNLWKYA